MRLTPSARRIAAVRCAFSRVVRDAISTQRTSTPNSFFSASRIKSASGVPPNTAPPVTSTGSCAVFATIAP